MRKYKIAVGIEGVTLERHEVEARNMDEARSIGISKFLHPDKGYNYINVVPVKATAKK